ncbi:MAG TPA: hypothetical protein VHC94_18610 [Nitrobacter sp.]|nr:hypothetical protein [Nitrobacter sp.]
MNWDWASSLDHLWRSPTFPMWVTLIAAGFFAIVVLLTLLRAEKSVANGALTVITLLAIAVAVAATIREFGGGTGILAQERASAEREVGPAMPALSCIDDLAGSLVEDACEKVLFGSPDAVAAAVSYTAARISRLTSLGAVARETASPELEALRHAIERDRYGLVAYVLMTRDGCKPASCAAYQSITDHNQIAAHMEERTYEQRVARYAPSWGGASAIPSAVAAGATAVPGMPAIPAEEPTGKPTSADFPSSASIPPVNIMTPEPSAGAPAASSAAAQPVPTPRPAPAKKPTAARAHTAPAAHAAPPVRLTPPAPPAAGAQN